MSLRESGGPSPKEMGIETKENDPIQQRIEEYVPGYIQRAREQGDPKNEPPGFEGSSRDGAKKFINMILRDLRNSAEDPNPETNPDFVGLEGFEANHYSKLANAVEQAAKEAGIL